MRKKPITSFAQNSDRALRGGRTSFKTRRGERTECAPCAGRISSPSGELHSLLQLALYLKAQFPFPGIVLRRCLFLRGRLRRNRARPAAGSSFRHRKTAVSRRECLLPRRTPNMVDNRIRSVVLLYVNKILPNKRYTVWKTVGN